MTARPARYLRRFWYIELRNRANVGTYRRGRSQVRIIGGVFSNAKANSDMHVANVGNARLPIEGGRRVNRRSTRTGADW